MIGGDLATMPLADLLQWAETTRRSGVLVVEREAGTAWMRLEAGQLVEASKPPPSKEALHRFLPEAADRPWLRLPDGAEAVERLLDLFLDDGGRFEFREDAAVEAPGVAVDVPPRELVHEGMRHLDELPRLEETYPDDTARLGITGRDPEQPLRPIHRVLLRCAASGLNLGEARLSLGLSRAGLLRRVHELVSLGLMAVEGTREGEDPVARLITQAQGLARAHQFDEAAHVFRALLEADPGNRRLRHLLSDVEEAHLGWLKASVASDWVPRLRTPATPSAPRLSATDRQVAAVVDGRRDVAAIVLASPLRELETLKSLLKLEHLGLIGPAGQADEG